MSRLSVMRGPAARKLAFPGDEICLVDHDNLRVIARL